MISDAPAAPGQSSWSLARRKAKLELLQALDRSPFASNTLTRAALNEFVDVLVGEACAPEAVLIALKDALIEVPSLQRLEPLLREQIRAALVSACIDRYFDARGDDAAAGEIRPRVWPGVPLRSDACPLRSADLRDEQPRE